VRGGTPVAERTIMLIFDRDHTVKQRILIWVA